MTRDAGIGGKVDIYISALLTNSNTYTSHEESYTYTDLSLGSGATDTLNDVILEKQPVRLITSIEGSVSGDFTEGVDYELQITETSNIYYGSTEAVDKIHWLLDSPTEGETITITYYYYSLMEELGVLIEANRTVTADVLVKLAFSVDVNCTVTVYADETITADGETTFNDSIVSAISTYLTSNNLGRTIHQSDIVDAIYSVSGVDRVALPFTTLNAPSKTAYTDSVYDEIVFTEQEYSEAGTIDVNVIRSS